MKSIKEIIKSSPILSKYAFNVLNALTARKQYAKNKEVLCQLKELRGKYEGKRCFIIGTGPSLTIEDLECLKGEYTFATNRIYELFDKTEWRPTFYVNQDHDLIRKFGDRIRQVDATLKFLPVEYVAQFVGDAYRFFVLKHKEFYPHSAPFSRDVSKYLAQGYTVTYGAIQLAVYLGFKKIYLLGIDHNYAITRDAKGKPVRSQGNSSNYGAGISNYVNMKNLPRIEETTVAFETAEKLSRRLGVKIYNATRGGKLEAFERISLEKVLEVK